MPRSLCLCGVWTKERSERRESKRLVHGATQKCFLHPPLFDIPSDELCLICSALVLFSKPHSVDYNKGYHVWLVVFSFEKAAAAAKPILLNARSLVCVARDSDPNFLCFLWVFCWSSVLVRFMLRVEVLFWRRAISKVQEDTKEASLDKKKTFVKSLGKLDLIALTKTVA